MNQKDFSVLKQIQSDSKWITEQGLNFFMSYDSTEEFNPLYESKMESKGYSWTENRKKVDTGYQTVVLVRYISRPYPLDTIRSPSYSSKGKSDRGRDTTNHLQESQPKKNYKKFKLFSLSLWFFLNKISSRVLYSCFF